MAENTPSWWGTLEQQATRDGVNPEFLRRTAGQESGFRNVGNTTSSAQGPFQFLKGTWTGLSDRHPDLALTNRFDPDQQARAIGRFTKENLDIMSGALGRRVTGGEAYLAHFLGTGDAPRVVKASDDTPLTSVVQSSSIAANPGVFNKYKTVGQLRAWSERVSGGVSPYGDAYVPREVKQVPIDVEPVEGARIRTADATPFKPFTFQETQEAARVAEKKASEEGYSTGEALGASLVNESALSWLLTSNPGIKPDAEFRWTKERQERHLRDVPDEYKSFIVDRAWSDEHAQWLKQRLAADIEYERKMDEFGMAGIGLKLLGAIADPVGWGAAVLAAPIGGVAKGGRVATILARGAEGAIGGIAQAAPIAAEKPTASNLDILYAGAGGMALGSAFGALAHNPAVSDLAAQSENTAKSLMQDIQQQVLSGDKSVGAAQASPRMPVRADTSDWLGPAVEEAAPKAFMGWSRYDFAGLLGKSKNLATRLIGAHMVEDAAGRTKGATPFSVSEMQKKMQLGFETRYMQDYTSSFKQWADDLDLNWADRRSREGEFGEMVTAAVRNQDPTVTFHPAVEKMAAANRKLYKDYLELAQNPGVLDGTVMRPVRGFDPELVAHSDNYIPRIISREKFQDWSQRFGDRQIGAFIADAVRGARPDIDPDIAERIGRGWYKRIRDVQAGQEMTSGRAMFGEDLHALREALADSTTMSADEIERLLAQFSPRGEEGAISRAKHRTLMDENFRGALKDNVTGEVVEVRLSDIFESNNVKLFQMYNRQLSGQIALARLRIKNPKWKTNPDAGPEYLVDGVTSRGEWDTLMKQVSSVGDELDGSTTGAKLTQKDVERLNFIYNEISGQGKPSSQWLRLVRDYNFIRVMNQVGFAQIADAGQLVAQAGFRASLEGMPALKSLWRNAKTGKLSDDLMQELEYITSGGTDWLRGSVTNRFDDFGENVVQSGSTSALDKAEAIMQKGKRATQVMSMMAPVNTYLQRWAGKAALARFVNDAAGNSSVNLRRLQAMGLDEEMIKRVQSELKSKVQYVDSDMRTAKIKTLNLDAWNPEVRNAFENSLWRMTRRLVQENDLGQSNMFLSSDLGRLLFQFRSFMLASWTKQFLYGVHMRDWTTFVGFSMSSALGGAVYAGQTHLQSIGRSDQQKFLDDRLSVSKLGAATFQRAGWASFMPMGADFGLQALGLDPFFNTRASGLSSDLFGNPTFDLADKTLKAVGGVAETVTKGSPFTQPDARRLASVGPFQNFLPWMNMYSTFISSLPEKETRSSR